MAKGSSGLGGAGGKTVPGSYSDKADSMVRNLGNYVGDRSVESQLDDVLNHRLGANETSASVDDFKIIQNPIGSGVADVEVNYSVNVKVPYTYVDSDGISHTDYDYDTVARTSVIQVKVLN